MRPSDIRARLIKQPFEPIRHYLSDGATFDVRHPEMALVGPTEGGGRRWNLRTIASEIGIPRPDPHYADRTDQRDETTTIKEAKDKVGELGSASRNAVMSRLIRLAR